MAINNFYSLTYPLFMNAEQVRRNTNKQRCHNRSQCYSSHVGIGITWLLAFFICHLRALFLKNFKWKTSVEICFQTHNKSLCRCQLVEWLQGIRLEHYLFLSKLGCLRKKYFDIKNYLFWFKKYCNRYLKYSTYYCMC